MVTVEPVLYTESRRAELRALIKLASDVIPALWPLRTAIAINPLVGLEHQDFHEAIRRAQQCWGGRGYLPSDLSRAYYREGRITREQVDAALAPLATQQSLNLGGTRITHLDVLRVHLLHGIPAPAPDVVEAMVEDAPERDLLHTLGGRLGQVLGPLPAEDIIQASVQADRAALGHSCSLAQWCDRAVGTTVWGTINEEMIKWCAGFLDEGQSAWSMPLRETSFYETWRRLARHDLHLALHGVDAWQRALADLPSQPEDAILDSLAALGLPETVWQDYFALHLAALPGWAGQIKWRAEQPDPVSAAWVKAYPIDLTQYLAVRLWYEEKLVQATCRTDLGIEGTYGSLAAYMHREPVVYVLRRDRTSGHLPAPYADQVDRLTYQGKADGSQAWKAVAARYVADLSERQHRLALKGSAWRVASLAKALGAHPVALLDCAPADLKTLLGWVEAFPEEEHGPRWLEALEAGVRDELVGRLASNAGKATAPSPTHEVRPLAQAIFCIDARSERYRRHLEDIGGYETFGFAGFFLCFIRFRAFDSHHEVNSFPVIMKTKNLVREIPRSVSGMDLPRYRTGARLIRAVQALLHDLKEHVITPYVMVESLGWFFSLPFLGKTLIPQTYERVRTALAGIFAPPIATTLTVDKLTREDVEEMLGAEQRATIRRALREHFGLSGTRLSPSLIEALRRQALEKPVENPVQVAGLSDQDIENLITVLRKDYGISPRWALSQMNRITQTGFTLDEQVVTVETALRIMGLTRNYGRLVAFVAHGSRVDNNPYEAALECGACGGNSGNPNVRLLSAMANKPAVRKRLEKNGLFIPDDTHFIGGLHDTCTDEVHLFDLEDIPSTHRKDLLRFFEDLRAAGRQTAQERLTILPDAGPGVPVTSVGKAVGQRSTDWSQVRPEWGLANNAAVVIGRRRLTQGLNLDGRVFMHSYDYLEDPTGKALEIILTAPGQVMEWINLGYYFSTVDNETFGAGNKIYHNVVGRLGVMSGTQSDLRIGLPWQSVMVRDERPYHEPVRLLIIVEAPPDRITSLIQIHPILQRFYDNGWVRLVALDREESTFYQYQPRYRWEKLSSG